MFNKLHIFYFSSCSDSLKDGTEKFLITNELRFLDEENKDICQFTIPQCI